MVDFEPGMEIGSIGLGLGLERRADLGRRERRGGRAKALRRVVRFDASVFVAAAYPLVGVLRVLIGPSVTESIAFRASAIRSEPEISPTAFCWFSEITSATIA